MNLIVRVFVLDEDVENGAGIGDGHLRLLRVGRLDDVILGERCRQHAPENQKQLKDY